MDTLKVFFFFLSFYLSWVKIGDLEGGSQQGEGGGGRGESFPLNLGACALHHPRPVKQVAIFKLVL